MTEESKMVELTDEQIEKVVGGYGGQHPFNLLPGYYRQNTHTYYYLSRNAHGMSRDVVSVMSYELKADQHLHRDGHKELTLGVLSDMERVAPDNVPPIRQIQFK